MTDKQLHYIEGVGWRYDCDHSMTHRMRCYNYKARSIYMLTITLADRSHPLLGTLRWKQKEEKNVGKADETNANKAKETDTSSIGEIKATAKGDSCLPSPLDREAVVDLTPLGERVRDCWEQIPAHYPDVRTIILQIMPEHLHGVLFVTQDQEAHLGQMVKGFKIGCSKAWWELNPSLLFDTPQNAAKAASSSAPSVSSATAVASSSAPAVSSAPSVSTAPFCSPNYNSACTTGSTPRPLPRSKGAKGPSLFASGYNDSVLMGKGQLANMIRYVQQNPLRAMIKREHSDLFRIVRELRFGGHTFAAIGNHWLLERPHVSLPVRKRSPALLWMLSIHSSLSWRTAFRLFTSHPGSTLMPAPRVCFSCLHHGPTTLSGTPSPASNALPLTTSPMKSVTSPGPATWNNSYCNLPCIRTNNTCVRTNKKSPCHISVARGS